jgi:fatty acid desaturase
LQEALEKPPADRREEAQMSQSSSSNGIGFAGLLAIVFITLKLLDKIDWSWWWVLAPIWIPAIFIVGALLVVVCWAKS